MRRMKDMAAMQPGMSFYGELPDSYNLIVNVENPVVKRIMEHADGELMPELKPIFATIADNNAKSQAIRDNAKDGKMTDDEQKQVENYDESTTHQRSEEKKLATAYAASQPLVRQVIDLALLANGLLRGQELNEFIKRSVKLL